MSRFLYRLGRFAVRRRRLVLAGWLAALVLLGAGGQLAGGKFRDDFKVHGSGSQQAQALLTAKFPSQAGSSAQVVVHARAGTLNAGPNAPALASTLTGITSSPRSEEHTSELQSPMYLV